MDSNRNTVLHVILLGLAALLLCGLAGCTPGTNTNATEQQDRSPTQGEAVKKAARLEKENAELKEKVAKLEKANEALEKKVKHLETLKKIAADTRRLPIDSTPKIEGVVQKVDNELKFVMLSVGRDDNVSRGMRFHISRNGSYVGEVRVDYVYPKACSASFVTIKPGMNIQAGDTACTRL